MVEVLGHVGEGFVAEQTLVEGIWSVTLPEREGRAGRKRHVEPYQLRAATVFPSVASPVHDKSHLRGEAAAAVHAQVPGHARVGAHVALQRCRLLEHFPTIRALVRALLVHARVSGQPVHGGEGAMAQVALVGLGTERYLLLGYFEADGLRPVRSFVPPSRLFKATHDARRLSALLVLTQEVLPLVLQVVFRGLEYQGALGAFVRVDDHQVCRPLLPLGSVLDTGDQPQLQFLKAIFQDPQVSFGSLVRRRKQYGIQPGAPLIGSARVVGKSLSREDLKVHGGRAGGGDYRRQQGGAGQRGSLGRRLIFPLKLLLLLLGKYLEQTARDREKGMKTPVHHHLLVSVFVWYGAKTPKHLRQNLSCLLLTQHVVLRVVQGSDGAISLQYILLL